MKIVIIGGSGLIELLEFRERAGRYRAQVRSAVAAPGCPGGGRAVERGTRPRHGTGLPDSLTARPVRRP